MRRFRVDVPGIDRPVFGHWGRHAGWVWTVASATGCAPPDISWLGEAFDT